MSIWQIEEARVHLQPSMLFLMLYPTGTQFHRGLAACPVGLALQRPWQHETFGFVCPAWLRHTRWLPSFNARLHHHPPLFQLLQHQVRMACDASPAGAVCTMAGHPKGNHPSPPRAAHALPLLALLAQHAPPPCFSQASRAARLRAGRGENRVPQASLQHAEHSSIQHCCWVRWQPPAGCVGSLLLAEN